MRPGKRITDTAIADFIHRLYPDICEYVRRALLAKPWTSRIHSSSKLTPMPFRSNPQSQSTIKCFVEDGRQQRVQFGSRLALEAF